MHSWERIQPIHSPGSLISYSGCCTKEKVARDYFSFLEGRHTENCQRDTFSTILLSISKWSNDQMINSSTINVHVQNIWPGCPPPPTWCVVHNDSTVSPTQYITGPKGLSVFSSSGIVCDACPMGQLSVSCCCLGRIFYDHSLNFVLQIPKNFLHPAIWHFTVLHDFSVHVDCWVQAHYTTPEQSETNVCPAVMQCWINIRRNVVSAFLCPHWNNLCLPRGMLNTQFYCETNLQVKLQCLQVKIITINYPLIQRHNACPRERYVRLWMVSQRGICTVWSSTHSPFVLKPPAG